MQSGLGKSNKWILEFETRDPTRNPLMGWESSNDTLSELNLEFSSKELAIEYAKKNKIHVISFTGRSGGFAKKNSDININIKSQKTSFIQEAHMSILHCICELLENEVK